MARFSRPGRVGAALLALSALFAATSCGSGAPAKTTATWAEPPGASPNYIFPLASLRYFSTYNLGQFQELMYRPLYWFGEKGQVKLNDPLSLANPPVFSADGKAVTITLRPYKWSDGTAVTTRDVEFWINLQKANKSNWAGYSPGEWPDNLAGLTLDSPTQMTLKLTQAYGAYFFIYNELSQITPIPQHVWDRESVGQAIGDYDRTPEGALAVYQFLDGQSNKLSTYATNPLWQVVDGPWKLSKFDPGGSLTMVPNPRYSGPVKPKLTQFTEVPFAKDGNELDQLKQGPSATNALDYGYVPIGSASKSTVSTIKSLGYAVDPWHMWSITFVALNFTNPTSGPLFSQPYFRQALQHLVDQQTYISKAFNGYAVPVRGPVPMQPPNAFDPPAAHTDHYPFDVGAATSLLQSHGWTVNPGGVSACASPGTAANQCGAGIGAGATATLKLQYAGGIPALRVEMTQLKTDFAKAGIAVTLSEAAFNTVIANAVPCVAGQACKWDMAFWGAGWVYAPDYYPTGDEIFSTGAGANAGGYSSASNDQLTAAAQTSSSTDALRAYADNLATELPVLWLPTQDYQVSAINTRLHGALPQDALLQIYPETWSWT